MLWNKDGSIERKTSTFEPKHKMNSRLFLNIVVTQWPTILKLLPSKEKALLIRRYALPILYLAFYCLNTVRGFYMQSYGWPCQWLDKYLHIVGNNVGHNKIMILLDADVVKCPQRYLLHLQTNNLHHFFADCLQSITYLQLFLPFSPLESFPYPLGCQEKMIWSAFDR